MARGKHAGKNNTFFGDENYYKRRNEYIKEENDEIGEKEIENESEFSNNNEYDYEEEKNFSDYDEYDEKNINLKRVLIIVFIIAIIIFIVAFLVSRKNQNDTNVQEGNSNTQSMSSQYEGYKVLGQIKIDKIGISQYILDSTDDNALKKGVGKLYGGSLNNYGNFCIVGHNYDEIFAKLSDLTQGDIITIIDKKMKESKYKITSITSVEPDNLECLTQNDSKIELTLITCQTGSTKRLVVKAEEVK